MRYFLILLLSLPCCLSAQFKLSNEVLFYSELFKAGQQLKSGYNAVNEIKDKSAYFRDAIYKIHANEPLDPGAGTLVTDQIKTLYDWLENVVETYELPVIEDIPETPAPYDGSREAISYFLTNYTGNATFYYSKLKIYLEKQKELDTLERLIKELKIENSRIAKLYVNLLQDVPMTTQIQGLVNDWYKLETTFSRQLADMLRTIKNKKKKWSNLVDLRLAQYKNYKSNLLLALELERKNIQDAFNDAKKELKEYDDQIKKLKNRISTLEEFKVKIEEGQENIRHYNYQIEVLNQNNQGLGIEIEKHQDRLNYLSSEKYLSNYTGCPENFPYRKCNHTDEKKAFDDRLNAKKRKAREKIAALKESILENKKGIEQYLSKIEKQNKVIQELKKALLELPQWREELLELEKIRQAFLERIDVYFIFKLMFVNDRNSQAVQNLPDTL